MLKILIAEDEIHISSALQMFLESKGYFCVLAKDGLAAQEVLALNNFDLLITDIGMPRMNGVELIKYIRAEDKKLKIICFSAYIEIMDAELDTLKIDKKLEKPIDLILLQEAIEELF